MTVDEFAQIVEDVVDQLPPACFQDLNGGVLVLEEEKHHPHAPSGTVILGEYVVRPWLGRHVALYYGSFMKAHGELSASQMRRRITDTILHELTHHLESRAGINNLGRKDVDQIRRLWDRYQGRD